MLITFLYIFCVAQVAASIIWLLIWLVQESIARANRRMLWDEYDYKDLVEFAPANNTDRPATTYNVETSTISKDELYGAIQSAVGDMNSTLPEHLHLPIPLPPPPPELIRDSVGGALTPEETRHVLKQLSAIKSNIINGLPNDLEVFDIFGIKFLAFRNQFIYVMDETLQQCIANGCMLSGMTSSAYVSAAVQFFLKWHLASKAGNVRTVYDKHGQDSGVVIYTKPQKGKIEYVEPTAEEKEHTEQTFKDLGVNHKVYIQ